MRMRDESENSERKRICGKEKGAEFALFIFYKKLWLMTCLSLEAEKMIEKKTGFVSRFSFSDFDQKLW